jgi:acyl carrier protein
MITDVDILKRMNAVVMDILEIPDLSLHRDTTAKDIKGWDSLAHINIIVAMEHEFGVKFTLADVRKLKDVGGFVDLVKSKTP